VIRLPSGGDLQAAISALKPGDELRLASGATWTGQFLLPTFSCAAVTSWITIRTDIDDSQLPSATSRITPSYSSRLAKITSIDNAPALNTTGPICGLRLLGLEFAHTNPPGVQAYGTVALGVEGWVAGGGTQTTLSRVPQDIIIDRVYMHGAVTSDNARCLALNTGRTVIINSWIAECHSKGLDSQAIEGWNGPGPYLIENNFLSSSGENVMFGGADPGIPNLIPSDITIRRNHFWKDPAWKAAGWLVKNLFETKNAQRVLVEGNVFENNWISGQMGMAIVIKSSFDGCPTCLWQGSTDITFRYNIVRNSPRGFNVQGHDSPSNRPVARVRFENNLLYNIGVYNGTGEDGWQNLITHDARDIWIEHNTYIGNSGWGLFLSMAYGPPDPRQSGGGFFPSNININNNVTNQAASYAIFNDGGAVGTNGLNTYTSNGTWSFAGNVVPNVQPSDTHPQTSFYPSTTSAVGFMNVAAGDYRLSNGTAYLGKTTDSRVPGADIDEVNRRTAGVVVTP
jgi:hypothetical protein